MRAPLMSRPVLCRRLAADNENAAAGRFPPAEAAAQGNRLARHDAGCGLPWFIEYVSIIQAMTCSLVLTSGRGNVLVAGR